MPTSMAEALGVPFGTKGRSCIMQLDKGLPKLDLTEFSAPKPHPNTNGYRTYHNDHSRSGVFLSLPLATDVADRIIVCISFCVIWAIYLGWR